MKQTCPRRMHDYGPWEQKEGLDVWAKRAGVLTCSFCGSLHPDEVLLRAKAREWSFGPTDKSYKAYISTVVRQADEDVVIEQADGVHVGKFYFQHFDSDHRAEFIELHNAAVLCIGFPGHFYTLPFFCKVS